MIIFAFGPSVVGSPAVLMLVLPSVVRIAKSYFQVCGIHKVMWKGSRYLKVTAILELNGTK